jgi:aldehyde dehydrogenase (NAD+)
VLFDLVPKYFDPAVVTVVAGGKEQNTELLKLPFDFIFFTGSTVVGKIVARAAAENLTPVLFELGGMNPAVVDQTANVPDAAKKIVWGAMVWGGQWCTSPGYAYVHESIAAAFVAEAKKALLETLWQRSEIQFGLFPHRQRTRLDVLVRYDEVENGCVKSP